MDTVQMIISTCGCRGFPIDVTDILRVILEEGVGSLSPTFQSIVASTLKMMCSKLHHNGRRNRNISLIAVTYVRETLMPAVMPCRSKTIIQR